MSLGRTPWRDVTISVGAGPPADALRPRTPPSRPSAGTGARTGPCADRPPRPCSGPRALGGPFGGGAAGAAVSHQPTGWGGSGGEPPARELCRSAGGRHLSEGRRRPRSGPPRPAGLGNPGWSEGPETVPAPARRPSASHPPRLRSCYLGNVGHGRGAVRRREDSPVVTDRAIPLTLAREMTLPAQAIRGDVSMGRIRAGVILSVGLAVASCGGSSTEPEDSLTGAEALALLEVAMNPGLQLVTGDDATEIVTPDGAVLQFTAQCSMGGTVAVDARVTPSGGPGDDGGGGGSVGDPLFTRIAWRGTRGLGSPSPWTGRPRWR